VRKTISEILSTHHDLLEEYADTDPVSLETLLNRLEPTTTTEADEYEIPDEAPQTGVGEESIPQTNDPDTTTVAAPDTQVGAATTADATEPDQEIDFENPLAETKDGENPIVSAAQRSSAQRPVGAETTETTTEEATGEETRAEVTADTATVNIGSATTSGDPLNQPGSTDATEQREESKTSSNESTETDNPTDAGTVVTHTKSSLSPDPTWPSEFSSLIEMVFDEGPPDSNTTDSNSQDDANSQADTE
jgi:hypothetical protein